MHGLKAAKHPSGDYVHATEMCALCLRTARIAKPVRSKPAVLPQNAKPRDQYIAQWTLTTEAGVLTICGVCGGLVSDHWSKQKVGFKHLIALTRTRKCKYCGQWLEPDYERSSEQYECPESPEGVCKRRWLVKRVKVTACRLCTSEAQAEYQVEPDDLELMPDGKIRRCHDALRQWKDAV